MPMACTDSEPGDRPRARTLTLLADGGFTYTPVSNYFGSDSFTIGNDGDQLDGATANLTIVNVNRALSLTMTATA